MQRRTQCRGAGSPPISGRSGGSQPTDRCLSPPAGAVSEKDHPCALPLPDVRPPELISSTDQYLDLSLLPLVRDPLLDRRDPVTNKRLTGYCPAVLLDDLQDVVAENGLNHAADLSGLEAEGGLFDLRHRELSLGEPTQVAAGR